MTTGWVAEGVHGGGLRNRDARCSKDHPHENAIARMMAGTEMNEGGLQKAVETGSM